MGANNHETRTSNFDTSQLLKHNAPLANDDPALKGWIEENGSLYVNTAVIGVRAASAGEVVETWVNVPEGKVLERSVVAEEGQMVAVGVLGEQYVIPSAASLGKNKLPVGEDGLREGEVAPPLPEDGYEYALWRSNGEDYRIVATNPYENDIYLLTSSGRLQTGVPDGKIAAQISARPGEDPDVPTDHVLDVARFIAPEEFAASYQPASDDEYARFGLQAPL